MKNLKYATNFKLIVMFSISVAMYVHGNTVPLFNGKDLDGWEVYGNEKWYVEDSILIGESSPRKKYGYLGTKKTYKDFILTLEFKQVSDKNNSGVFVRSSVNGTKVKGWQLEIEPSGRKVGGVYESYGRGWLAKPSKDKWKVYKKGDWNSMKIKSKGSQLTCQVNGTQMVDLVDDQFGEGKGAILLQIHSGGDLKIKFRNLKIEEI